MAHRGSEALELAAVVSVEQTAQAGVRLAFPGLAAARPAIVPPLAEVIEAACGVQLLGRSPRLEPARLQQAAASVFAELQALLAGLVGERLEGSWRRELWDAHSQPLLALSWQRGLAKRLQLQAAAGRPLTVCFGKRARSLPLPAPHQAQVYAFGDGCGLVHPDATGLRRPSFRYYCHDCRRRESSRQAAAVSDGVARWQGRERVLAYDANGEPVPAWYGQCSRCPNHFTSLQAQVRRCPRCQAGHR
jgi:hypothetical protein